MGVSWLSNVEVTATGYVAPGCLSFARSREKIEGLGYLKVLHELASLFCNPRAASFEERRCLGERKNWREYVVEDTTLRGSLPRRLHTAA